MPKTRVIVVSSIGVVFVLALGFFRADLVKLFKNYPFVMQALILVMGIIGGAITAWIFKQKSKEGKEAAGGAGAAAAPPVEVADLDLLIDEAQARLAAGELGKDGALGKLPAVFLLGDTGSAKTTTMEHSGLDAELLAGQVYEETNLVPTPIANFWFASRTVFVEAAGKVSAGPDAWAHMVQRMQPSKLASVLGRAKQPPRAAVVFVEAETLAMPEGEEALAASARNLRSRLAETSQLLGINLPVYVVFTKTDRIPFFVEYVRNLGEDEVSRTLGAMVAPVFSRKGIYAEEETTRLNGVFERIFRGLANGRPGFLSREHDAAQLGGIYEFPREFRKLRAPLVRFLVELCRPSQLTVSPFLRGFFFTGVRPVVVNEVAPAPPSRAPEPQQDRFGATSVFRSLPGSQAAAAAAPRVIGTRKVPQWLFLGRLFHNILPEDTITLGAGSSTRVSFLRRAVLASVAILCLLYSAALVVSFSRNRALETTVKSAAREIAAIQPNQATLASRDSLARLESMRQALETLTDYERTHPPLSYRWGLYAGDTLYPVVRKLYFDAFRKLLLTPVQNSMLDTMRGLPETPGPEYSPTYDTLKGYLITTSNPDKSTRAFLSPVLSRIWTGGRSVDGESLKLAQKQFDFYSDELKLANPFSGVSDTAAIQKARRYLSLFGDLERVYGAMLADAAKNNPPIVYSKRFPNNFVIDTQEVAGPFSKPGWDFMKNALKNPARYFSGEQWVLGDQAVANVDQGKLGQLSARYYADFVKQWRAYLKGAAVMRYGSLGDAAKALNALSGNQSPLLALFWLASQNTAVDVPEVAAQFQPVQAVVPPGSVDRYIAQPNQTYMNALVTLQASVEGAAAQQPVAEAVANQTLANATAAKVAARQVAQGFRIDPEAHVEATVQKLMEDPITNVEALLRNIGPAELNGKGRGLCAAFRGLMGKYPFNPNASAQATVAEVNAVFRKPDGALWAFHAANLQKLLPQQGTQFVAAPAGGVNLNPAFVRFFNQAAALSNVLYAGGSQDPRINYSLKPMPSEGIQNMGVQLDGQSLSYRGGDAPPKAFTWQGGGTHEARATVKFGGGPDLAWSSNDGLWAVFQFFGKAEQWRPSGNANILEWVIRIGRDPVTLPGGKPLTVRFELNMGGAPELFQKGYFSRMACVADVAR
jgi:type VI secretion system protein ImpL